MSYVATEEAYLCHHGVKGMKWGVRRNRDNISGGGKSRRYLQDFDSPGDAKARKIGGQLGVNVKRTAQAAGGKVANRGIAAVNTWDQRAELSKGFAKRAIGNAALGAAGSALRAYGKQTGKAGLEGAGTGLMVAAGTRYVTDAVRTNMKASKLLKDEYSRLEGKRKANELIQMQANKERNRAAAKAQSQQQASKPKAQQQVAKPNPHPNASASRKAVMAVGGAMMNIPGMKTLNNAGMRRAGLAPLYPEKKKKK